MTGVTLFGVPIDCVGEPVGTVRTPGVLRDAGVVDALGARDLGDLDVFLGPAEHLVFLDGHLDLYDGESSPWGEAAGMPVAVLLGRKRVPSARSRPRIFQ